MEFLLPLVAKWLSFLTESLFENNQKGWIFCFNLPESISEVKRGSRDHNPRRNESMAACCYIPVRKALTRLVNEQQHSLLSKDSEWITVTRAESPFWVEEKVHLDRQTGLRLLNFNTNHIRFPSRRGL